MYESREAKIEKIASFDSPHSPPRSFELKPPIKSSFNFGRINHKLFISATKGKLSQLTFSSKNIFHFKVHD